MCKALAILCLTAAMALAADLSGEWVFSVDLEGGGHGDPTFVLKQGDGKITGKYRGPMGELNVAGTVAGNQAVFGFDFERDGEKGHATYTATIDGPAKMHGKVEFKQASGEGASGTWTAAKK